MTTSSILYSIPLETNIMLFNITSYIEKNKIFGCDNRYDLIENDTETMRKINLIHKQNELLEILNGSICEHAKLDHYHNYSYLFTVGISEYNICKGGLMDDFNMYF
jgi:hypothetical protein